MKTNKELDALSDEFTDVCIDFGELHGLNVYELTLILAWETHKLTATLHENFNTMTEKITEIAKH